MSDKCIYLVGNSLGLQPKGSRELLQQEMDKWSRKGLYGYFKGTYPWFSMEDFLMEQYSHIMGCKKEEVTAMNSLTANIHFALVRLVCEHQGFEHFYKSFSHCHAKRQSVANSLEQNTVTLT